MPCRSQLKNTALSVYILLTALFKNYSKNTFAMDQKRETIHVTVTARARTEITAMKPQNLKNLEWLKNVHLKWTVNWQTWVCCCGWLVLKKKSEKEKVELMRLSCKDELNWPEFFWGINRLTIADDSNCCSIVGRVLAVYNSINFKIACTAL